MTYTPSEDLLERLSTPVASADDVMELLRGQYDALVDAGMPASDPGYFFDINSDPMSYRLAMAWWPKLEALPAQLAPPSLYQLCWNYHDPATGATFYERLTTRSAAVVMWLESAGIDPAQPNESPQERKARANREAQARYRARKVGAAEATHAQALADAYRAYMDACAERKAAYDAVTPKVEAAHAAWQKLKQRQVVTTD